MDSRCVILGLDEAVEVMLRSVTVGAHFKHIRQTEKGFLCVPVCNNLREMRKGEGGREGGKREKEREEMGR